ncbi:MAG TPA: nucleoside triphosphate pyrophosphohydrolase [Longimicrobiales bacterium]
MSAGYLVKLVRDGIPALLKGEGTLTYEPMPKEEHVKHLRRKLVEEAMEYVTDPSVGELGDVLAVVRDLAVVDLGVEWEDVFAAERRKRRVRGGFADGIGMYGRHPSDTDRWPA